MKTRKGIAGFLAAALLLSLMPGKTMTAKAAESENLVKNGNFALADDLSVWSVAQGGAVITAEEAEEPIFGTVRTYGKITGRSSNYECFAQDFTGIVENNEVYEYTFYVMLDPVDYDGAPAAQRTVEISPFITVNGSTTYSQGVSGTVTKALEPGVWTKFTGNYCPSWNGEAEQVAIRILEQGTNYGQGEGVKGTYYVTGVSLSLPSEELLIEEDAVNLCDAVAAQTDDDFIMGTAICNGDLLDANEMALVTKHFNALTLGNELKPDAMFGYSNNRCPGTETAVLNGEEITVPKLDYSRAEKTLNYVLKWNEKHPDKQIKVRGHVLVWHSQTPEWWFHEDYDATKPYADADTMNKRLEWYIKTMAEHFTGPDSKYYGMFYGWDVVNEAVSDGSGTYRKASENSSWWAVYQSQEFIINAFRYANKYMDPSVDLYYNDYNECGANKRKGIVQLLTDVKEAEGARIDGMGMQGHYGTAGSPTSAEFEASIRAYAAVVDKVMVTENDMGVSSYYDGTDATKEVEYSLQAYRYKELFDVAKKLRAEGIRFVGFTVWGVVDKYSWLQSSSNVGGGADGKKKQCPLLFDDDYQIKPAFWAFADATQLKPVAQDVPLKELGSGGNMSGAVEYSFAEADVAGTFRMAWADNYLFVKMTVDDVTTDDNDAVILYASLDEKTILKKEIKRSDAMERLLKGYEFTTKFEFDNIELKEGDEVLFDVVIVSGDKRASFSDRNHTQDSGTSYYAKASLVANPDNKKDEAKSTPTPTPAPTLTPAGEENEEGKAGEETPTKGADEETGKTPAEDGGQTDTVDSKNSETSNFPTLAVVLGAAVLVCLVCGTVIFVRRKQK